MPNSLARGAAAGHNETMLEFAMLDCRAHQCDPGAPFVAKGDKEIALQAAKQEGRAHYHAGEKQKGVKFTVREAAEQHCCAVLFASEELNGDKCFALELGVPKRAPKQTCPQIGTEGQKKQLW